MSTEHADIQYLKSDYVGKVIAQGLAELYREKPEFPIDYLSKWLHAHSNQQAAMKRHQETQAQASSLIADLEREKKRRVEETQVVELEREEKKRRLVGFEEYIANTEYPDELVGGFFPQGIFDLVEGLTAVYTALYEYQRAEFDPLENDDELAHLNLAMPKVIQYVGGDAATAVGDFHEGTGLRLAVARGARRDLQALHGARAAAGRRRGARRRRRAAAGLAVRVRAGRGGGAGRALLRAAAAGGLPRGAAGGAVLPERGEF